MSKCERHVGGSGDDRTDRTGTDVTVDREARERISKECGDVTRVVKLLATKMTEKDELARKEIERASLDATKRLTEIITRTREETSENAKMVERATKIAPDVEKSASGRADRLTHEFTGMKKVVQDSIDEIKLRLERQGVPETTKAPATVSSGSADRLIARRLGDLETRVGNGEADSNRKSEAQRELLADVRSEVADPKNRLGNTRDASRGHARSRSSSAETGAWRRTWMRCPLPPSSESRREMTPGGSPRIRRDLPPRLSPCAMR